MAYLKRFGPGFRNSAMDGDDLDQAFAYLFGGLSYQAGITALAGGAKAGATQLTETINQIDTVTTAADSVLLPPARPGSFCVIINNSANATQVFGQGTDTINGVATATGLSQAGNKAALYVCAKAGAWFRNLSA